MRRRLDAVFCQKPGRINDTTKRTGQRIANESRPRAVLFLDQLAIKYPKSREHLSSGGRCHKHNQPPPPPRSFLAIPSARTATPIAANYTSHVETLPLDLWSLLQVTGIVILVPDMRRMVISMVQGCLVRLQQFIQTGDICC